MASRQRTRQKPVDLSTKIAALPNYNPAFFGDTQFPDHLATFIKSAKTNEKENSWNSILSAINKVNNPKDRFDALSGILTALNKTESKYHESIKQLYNYLNCLIMRDGKYVYNLPCDMDRSLSAAEKSSSKQQDLIHDLTNRKQDTTIRHLTNKMEFYFGATLNDIKKNVDWKAILDPGIAKDTIFVNVPSAFILDVLVFNDDGMPRDENNIRTGNKYRLESIDNWSNEERYNILWYIDRDFAIADNIEQLSWYIVANMDPNGYIPCRLVVSNTFKSKPISPWKNLGRLEGCDRRKPKSPCR